MLRVELDMCEGCAAIRDKLQATSCKSQVHVEQGASYIWKTKKQYLSVTCHK